MKESELIDKEEQKRQNARTFINAAQEMIESEGLENISAVSYTHLDVYKRQQLSTASPPDGSPKMS